MAEPPRTLSRTLSRALRAEWPALAWAALIFFLSSRRRPIPVELHLPHVDKLLHAVAFAVLAGLVARGVLAAGQTGRRALWVAVVAATLYGAVDEWHQSFVPGRESDPRDWAADVAGAVAGAALVVGLPRRRSRASIRG